MNCLNFLILVVHFLLSPSFFRNSPLSDFKPIKKGLASPIIFIVPIFPEYGLEFLAYDIPTAQALYIVNRDCYRKRLDLHKA